MSRKISRALTRIQTGLEDCLYLGNLDARRDWGHARDYVEAQWLMLQQPQPEDFVIASGVQHSVRDFVDVAGRLLGMRLRWEGKGDAERAIDARTGHCVVRIDPRYYRPTEVETLLGDASEARAKLGWAPRVSFENLVAEMVSSDMQIAKRDALVASQGLRTYNYRD